MLGGLSTFEVEYNACVSGGWLGALEEEAVASNRRDVMKRMKEVYIMYARLAAIAAFGCSE